MFQVGDTVRVRTGLAIGDDSLMSCAGRNLHVVAILQGGLVRCRYFHNNHTIDAAIKSEFLMLTATSIPPETKPLVCLNQHPEHQWEDSGMCLSKPYREELKDGAGMVRVVHRGMVKGPAVEVCSRPGCGLIRVRQEKKANPLLYTDPLTRDGYEHGICSCGQPWRVRSAERTVFYCVECGGALVAGPEPKEQFHHDDEALKKRYQDQRHKYADIIEERRKEVLRTWKDIAPSEPPKLGDPYPEVRCERCQCLTPVSELSRDAQGRMVCKHH